VNVRIRPALIAGAIAFAVIAIVAHGRSSPYNNYVLLAQAWLHGHAWITWPGAYIDALNYQGQYYVIEAPLPAVLLLPFVAIFGGANQTLLAMVLGAIAIGGTYELGARWGIDAKANAWICAFLLAGTDLLWCAMLGDVWFIAHVSAVCFTMLALVELAGKRRGWIVALCAACAFESRFSLALALPGYAFLLVSDADAPLRVDARARAMLGSFLAMLVPVAALWVWYNYARWGTWYDLGYTTWYHQDQAGSPTGSPFRISYLSYQLWSFFVQAPQRVADYPWLSPSLSGVALTWTSPALLLAFFARSPLRWVAALWALTILTGLPNFLYYVNGFAQFGMRHALDFEPFLVALMLLAVRRSVPIWGRVLIVYSIVASLWGVWYWNIFVRPSN
jgi:hypothetical protein